MPRVTENDVALAIVRIAASRSNDLCTFHRARVEVPNYVTLSSADLAQSETRPSEPMWHQLIRNIKSHYEAEGNYINDGNLVHVPRKGYMVTAAGKSLLK